jgi:hypothetical protein
VLTLCQGKDSTPVMPANFEANVLQSLTHCDGDVQAVTLDNPCFDPYRGIFQAWRLIRNRKLHGLGMTLNRGAKPTVLIVSDTCKFADWVSLEHCGSLVATGLFSFSRFCSMFGQLGMADISVAVTDSGTEHFMMKCHFDPGVYRDRVVLCADKNPGLRPDLSRSDDAFEVYKAKLVPHVLAANHASDSVMPYASDWHDAPFGAEDDGWCFRLSRSGPVLLLCRRDGTSPLTITVPKDPSAMDDMVALRDVLQGLDRKARRLGFTYFDFRFTFSEENTDSYTFCVLLRVGDAELRRLVPMLPSYAQPPRRGIFSCV